MKRLFFFLFLSVTFGACLKHQFYDGPSNFEDDFEQYFTLDDLLKPDDLFWSFTQLTVIDNAINVDTNVSHTGKKALRFNANRSTEEQLSKCSIAKQNMAFWEGETIQVTAWYYLKDTAKLDWLFLLDIEEQTAIGAGPGMRLALVDNYLRIEHKFQEKDILQAPHKAIEFPRNEWVKLVWEVKLSQQYKGTVRLWQNDILLIDSEGNRTLPKDFIYAQQGTKGMYSSVEFGATANSKDNPVLLWVDDVMIKKK